MMLDYETKSSFMVTVTADDQEGEDNSTTSIDVMIMVDDAHTDCTMADNNGLTSDCEALLDAQPGLGGSLDWTTDQPITMWEGVSISGDTMRVTRLDLRDKSLDGMVPAALGRLSALDSLLLNRNDLTGSIPMQLSYLGNLRQLNLHSNDLNGAIPDLSGMSSLEELYLSNNYDKNVAGSGLSGEVPAWLNDMAGLTKVWLWGNMLDGSVPDLSGLTNVTELKLAGNRLEGGVPEAAALPANVKTLTLHDNQLGGGMTDLSSLTSLRTLWLHTNGLNGEIGMLPASVTSVNLRDNELSGTIPDLSALDSLQWLRLQNNDLSGMIPGTLGDLDSVTKIWLHGNGLTGIEAGFGDASDTLTHLYLAGNSFETDTCLPGGLADVANNDFDDANLAACPVDGS